MNLIWFIQRDEVAKAITCKQKDFITYYLKFFNNILLLVEVGQFLINHLLSVLSCAFFGHSKLCRREYTSY